MSRRLQENLVLLTVLLFFIGIFVLSFDYGPRARLVPLPIAALGIALALTQLVWQNVRSLDELEVDMLEFISSDQQMQRRKHLSASAAAAGALTEAEERTDNAGFRKEARAFGIVAALVLLCLITGPLPAVFLFMAGYFGMSRLCSWPAAIGYALLGTAALYGLFGEVLNVQFNRGLLAPFISPYLHF
jgi:hypothetical protein